MALLAMAIPIPADKIEKWRAFVAEVNGPRKAELASNRKKHGVRERTFHQQTPMGDFVVVTLEGDDPAGAFKKFGQGDDAFTKWFAAQVKDIHGVDVTAPPPGPLPTQVVDTG
jgi:hypothetical protein